MTRVKSDLVHTLGNLLLRVLSKKLHSVGTGLKYHQDLFPYHGDSFTSAAIASENDRALITTLHELPGYRLINFFLNIFLVSLIGTGEL